MSTPGTNSNLAKLPDARASVAMGASAKDEHAMQLRPPADKKEHAVAGMGQIERHAEWPLLSRLPMRMTAAIPLPRFKVKDLLGLAAGQLVQSSWASTADVPLRVGAVQLSWSEFEVVDKRMAVRLTRLA